MKTGYGLLSHARMALKEHWAYTLGTYGRVLTHAQVTEIVNRLPEVKPKEDYIREYNIGRRSVDCVGLIKSYMWWNDGNIKYDASTDINADMAFAMAESKGLLRTIPEEAGICVYRAGHIGVYDLHGWVIEAKGTTSGVVRTPLTGTGSNNWTNWLRYEWLDYSTWEQIVSKAVDDPSGWIDTIKTSIASAKADGDTGALERNKFLIDLIMKIYSL